MAVETLGCINQPLRRGLAQLLKQPPQLWLEEHFQRQMVFADFHAAPEVSSPRRTAKTVPPARDLCVSNKGFLFLLVFGKERE